MLLPTQIYARTGVVVWGSECDNTDCKNSLLNIMQLKILYEEIYFTTLQN